MIEKVCCLTAMAHCDQLLGPLSRRIAYSPAEECPSRAERSADTAARA